MSEVESVTIELVGSIVEAIEIDAPAIDMVAIDTSDNDFVRTDGTVARIVKITKAEYDALDPKIATTLYLIDDE